MLVCRVTMAQDPPPSPQNQQRRCTGGKGIDQLLAATRWRVCSPNTGVGACLATISVLLEPRLPSDFTCLASADRTLGTGMSRGRRTIRVAGCSSVTKVSRQNRAFTRTPCRMRADSLLAGQPRLLDPHSVDVDPATVAISRRVASAASKRSRTVAHQSYCRTQFPL